MSSMKAAVATSTVAPSCQETSTSATAAVIRAANALSCSVTTQARPAVWRVSDVERLSSRPGPRPVPLCSGSRTLAASSCRSECSPWLKTLVFRRVPIRQLEVSTTNSSAVPARHQTRATGFPGAMARSTVTPIATGTSASVTWWSMRQAAATARRLPRPSPNEPWASAWPGVVGSGRPPGAEPPALLPRAGGAVIVETMLSTLGMKLSRQQGLQRTTRIGFRTLVWQRGQPQSMSAGRSPALSLAQ